MGSPERATRIALCRLWHFLLLLSLLFLCLHISRLFNSCPALRSLPAACCLPFNLPACVFAAHLCWCGAGVGASSLVAMQAQVFKAQQQAALVREGKLDPEEVRAR